MLGKRMFGILLLFILAVLPSAPYAETFYHWVDEKGVYNFTNDYEKVPLEYRGRTKRIVAETPLEERNISKPLTDGDLTPKEDNTGGSLDSEKNALRESQAQWEDQTRQASEDYEAATGRFVDESDKLIQRRYGSHQQYKSAISEMETLREERATYATRLAKAKEILNFISKEAGESSRDPQWTKDGSSSGQASRSAAKIQTDIHGRDKSWWAGKMAALRTELRQALDGYEKAYQQYTDYIEKLDRSRFGGLSLTQYQMISTNLGILKDDIQKQATRAADVNERIRKLIKEAEESKADLEWLKE